MKKTVSFRNLVENVVVCVLMLCNDFFSPIFFFRFVVREAFGQIRNVCSVRQKANDIADCFQNFLLRQSGNNVCLSSLTPDKTY